MLFGIPIRKEILPTYSETMYKHKGALETLKSELKDRIEDVEEINGVEKDMENFVSDMDDTRDPVDSID